MNPKVTISIPVYNVEKYIERSLLSALNQTYDNLEILVVDDKGSDDSMAIVNKVIVAHSRGHIVKIIDHNVNRGTGATKNSAIDNAEGDYLFFLDSDDYLNPNAITSLYNAIGPYDMAAGSFDEFDSNGNILRENLQHDMLLEGDGAIHKWQYEKKSYYVQTWNKLYRLKLLKDNFVRCIPSARCEDIFFTFQLSAIVKSLVCVKDITYHYNVGNQSSAMATIFNDFANKKAHEQFIRTLNEMARFVRNNKLQKNPYLSDSFWDFMMMNLNTICSSNTLQDKEKTEFIKDLYSVDNKAFDKYGTFNLKRIIQNILFFCTSPFIAKTACTSILYILGLFRKK